ncbi:hypothetical protein HID58_014443, partial [Brassica napus]
MSTESACGWSVPSLTGNLSIDLSLGFRPEVCWARRVQMRLLSGGSSLYHHCVSWSHPDPPCSCEIMWLVLSRGYVWEASSFGVVGRVLEVSVAAREGSRDSIRVSLVSMSPRVGFLIVAT